MSSYAREFSSKFGNTTKGDNVDSNAGRGQRVRLVRSMTMAGRKEFFQQTGISASTLQSWEDGKAGGLTAKGAKRLVAAVKKFGVVVSEQYLLNGTGNKPSFGEPRTFKFEQDGATIFIRLD